MVYSASDMYEISQQTCQGTNSHVLTCGHWIYTESIEVCGQNCAKQMRHQPFICPRCTKIQVQVDSEDFKRESAYTFTESEIQDEIQRRIEVAIEMGHRPAEVLFEICPSEDEELRGGNGPELIKCQIQEGKTDGEMMDTLADRFQRTNLAGNDGDELEGMDVDMT